ncbi:MAG: outer membrane beta-barrel protein [Fibrobacter sp.]|nr:outer membrane beta-barrel protein [Fibrobacter sp.]
MNMKFKTVPLIAGLLLTLSLPVMAQDSSDDEWISAPSDNTSSNEVSYDGSADSEFADDEEYASAYARYKSQATSKTEINRQRNEGFSRSVMLGVRVQGGVNTFLLGENDDGWGLGYQFGGGLLVKMNMGIKNLSLVPELTFNFRHYTFKKDMGLYVNKAAIDVTMFEIPITARYTFEDYNFFVGLGINLGLKLNGTSEFSGSGTTRENTVSTSGMEVGGLFDIGYMIGRFIHFDVRVVQCFTSLLNKTLVAEEQFYESTLNTFYTTAGISFLF